MPTIQWARPIGAPAFWPAAGTSCRLSARLVREARMTPARTVADLDGAGHGRRQRPGRP